MEKKLYICPQTEVALTTGAYTIMKTSIELLPDMAPKRRKTEVF